MLYANSNHHAFVTRLIPRWRYEFLGQWNSWQNWAYAAGSLLALFCLLRRSLNPGVPALGAAVALGLMGSYVGWHRANNKQHFGREIAEQRKSPFAAERAPLEDEHGLPCTPTPWAGSRRSISRPDSGSGTSPWAPWFRVPIPAR